MEAILEGIASNNNEHGTSVIKLLLLLFHALSVSVCMGAYVCAPCVCLMPAGGQRGHWIAKLEIHGFKSPYGYWEPNWDILIFLIKERIVLELGRRW